MKQPHVRNACIVYKNIKASNLLKEGFHLRWIASIDLKGLTLDSISRL